MRYQSRYEYREIDIFVSVLEQYNQNIDPTDLLISAHVADPGSFSSAAERLGLPKSRMSRRRRRMFKQFHLSSGLTYFLLPNLTDRNPTNRRDKGSEGVVAGKSARYDCKGLTGMALGHHRLRLPSVLFAAITDRRLELLRHVAGNEVLDIHQLAQALGRDYKNVDTDVKALEELGLLERVDGKLVAPFDEIDIRAALREAA